MTQSIPNGTTHFSPAASLAARGAKRRELNLFGPIRDRVHIKQKAVKHTPTDKLYDALISLLAGAHGLVEINTRLRPDPGLQRAFGPTACAGQSVVQETLNACSEETIKEMQQALDLIDQHHSQGYRHNYEAAFQLLDVDMSGMPCGPKAAFATRGYVAGQYHRRGRQLGRVLATRYAEVVVDQVCAGNGQLRTALQPLVEAAEATLHLDEAKRARTLIRVDAGAGTIDALNWLLARHYEILAKDYAGKRVVRLANTVTEWAQDPQWPERSFSWVSEPAPEYVRPVRRIAVRCRRQDGTFASGVLVCSLSAEQVLTLLGPPLAPAADPIALLHAYVTFYDLRGGGIETSLQDDKQGLGLTKRSKKRFEAQQMVGLLGTLAHNLMIWARQWLNCPHLQRYGGLRLVRDGFLISGVLPFDARARLVELLLNQDARLARLLIPPFRQ